MKLKIILIIIILFTGILGYAQERDTYQPDSVYRMNKVKSRIKYHEKTLSKAKQIYNYDQKGRLIELILTDNFSDDRIQNKTSYTYDENGKLLNETDTSYFGKSIEVTSSKMIYNKNEKLIKKEKVLNGKIVSEINYDYNLMTETEKLYRDGKVYREQITYYEFPNYSNRFTGTELADKNEKPQKFKLPDGRIIKTNPSKDDKTWDYKFENKFDAKQRIIERKRFVNEKFQDEIVYVYDDKGLLMERFQKTRSIKELFDYKYWE